MAGAEVEMVHATCAELAKGFWQAGLALLPVWFSPDAPVTPASVECTPTGWLVQSRRRSNGKIDRTYLSPSGHALGAGMRVRSLRQVQALDARADQLRAAHSALKCYVKQNKYKLFGNRQHRDAKRKRRFSLRASFAMGSGSVDPSFVPKIAKQPGRYKRHPWRPGVVAFVVPVRCCARLCPTPIPTGVSPLRSSRSG